MRGLCWYRLIDETWDELVARAAERDALSAVATNTRPWNPDFNLLGLIGEKFYEKLSGIPMNGRAELRDGGEDFPGIDVKATPHYSSPRLLRLATDPLKAPLYFLATVDLPRRRVREVRYATREMLAGAGVREYGHGPTLTLLEDELLSAHQAVALLARGLR